jgi:hypothetical protein
MAAGMNDDELARLADEVATCALPGPEFSKRLEALSKEEAQTLATILVQKRAHYDERYEHAAEQAREIGRVLDDEEGGA